MSQIFIGIDLAWGDKNPSGFCVLELKDKKLTLKEITLLYSLQDILNHVTAYSKHKVSIGIDAPLLVPNVSGNREIEKEFNRDFAKYKIAMLPVNRNLLTQYSKNIRSEELFNKLSTLGYKRDKESAKVVFEVYPHATIALCFNNSKILPYKRKKGRGITFIREQLSIYQNYLKRVIEKDDFFDVNVAELKGVTLKSYEDQLDAITSAYTLFYAQGAPVKYYKLDAIETFVTPI